MLNNSISEEQNVLDFSSPVPSISFMVDDIQL
ncbi:unnamed protein product, partial [marine sediment metagenome]